MGLQNFTGRPDDDDANSPSGTGGSPLPPGFPSSGVPAGNSGGSAYDADAVEEMLVDYNERYQNAEPTLFRDRLIEQVLSVLIGKTKSNALLVGPAGVGKTKIVEDIARRIALGDVLIPDQLKNHTVYELPIFNLVAGSAFVGALEEKVKSIVDYASDPKNKVILFMDEIHQLTSGSDGGTYTKIAQILKPALARGDMQVIGATTTQEARLLDDDPAFRRRFSRLVVDEITPDETAAVLKKIRPGLLAHYKQQITVTDDVLASVVRVADENSHAGSHRPDSAITLLDRAMADRVLEQKRLITAAIAGGDAATAQALQAIPRFPLTETRVLDVARRMLTGNTIKNVLDITQLSSALTERLQGQDSVLGTLVDRIAREELGVFPRTAPVAWLFAGASGVGKTETAKIVSEQLTGQEPIVLNMTEFHHESSMSRIIGAPPGYVGSNSNAELPFDSLESNPHRVILLDEFEKADRAVQRLFLQALDEGYITTARGKRIDFSKAFVFATTNAAREWLDGNQLGFGAGPKTVSNRSLNAALGQFFDAELLGRFSLVVGFNPIDEKVYCQVLTANYAQQRRRILGANTRLGQVLPTAIPDDELAAISKRTFVPSHGARPAARAVRAWIEDALIAAQTPGPVALVPQASANVEDPALSA
ncbi:ATP-dependent Clp protease ATP-binding subunit [Kribbella qitaiheensis]|uniref:ATP-dependent Clp protease ATP-binding subunit n=1 Tax=Kribbella qitaiheensis TaxID=1544730 RepID=A0A7G6WVU0_9ACTN|nr:AAA family ATPase [Kribbella qitaiheensis]QNE18105.1 ATP-dependent Clp protease ATP-binding subunit [Kribbella qitaiheensis]